MRSGAYFSSGYDEKRLLQKFGKVFEDAVIHKTVNASIEQQQNKGLNETILNTSLQDLVEKGVVSVENIPRVLEESAYVMTIAGSKRLM